MSYFATGFWLYSDLTSSLSNPLKMAPKKITFTTDTDEEDDGGRRGAAEPIVSDAFGGGCDFPNGRVKH